jgi:2-dehydropantoate 2-reductase
MSEPLGIMSIGAGAIGTYIGGTLALGGHRVVFVERPEVVEGLRSRGLRLGLPAGESRLPEPQVVDSIEKAQAIQDFDVAIFALKSFDTATFLASLTVPAESLPPFLCLSNGVENETLIAKVLGPEKVIAGSVTSAIGVRGTGEIVLERLRGLGIAAGHPMCERLVDAMDGAGLNAQLYSRAADMKWSKMLTNLVANATSAILDMPPAAIFAHPGLYRLEIEQLRESLRVMAAQGIKAVNLPGTPVRLLASVARFWPPTISRLVFSRALGGGRGDKMPSFHIDLHAGRGRSEVDFLNGAVVQAGERTDIPTPVNELLYDRLRGLTRGEIPLDRYRGQPEKLLGELG